MPIVIRAFARFLSGVLFLRVSHGLLAASLASLSGVLHTIPCPQVSRLP